MPLFIKRNLHLKGKYFGKFTRLSAGQNIRKHATFTKGRRVACQTRNMEVIGLSPIKGSRCFLEQETLPLLLSTGWFQERIRA